ncbi:TonB family protein [Chitinivorax sp. B]|uniref:TonB family protein n=1 Tax=Chitinivorax sp. B TaxID=2502235 RepID=UPI0010F4ACB5|nr:TonB family protein [Chitinivorax sp. B]
MFNLRFGSLLACVLITSVHAETPVNHFDTPPIHDALHLKNQRPVASATSRELGEHGQTIITVLIRRDGTLQDAKIKQSSGFPRLDNLSLDTVKVWKFEPGRRDGVPVVASVDIPFDFPPGDTANSIIVANVSSRKDAPELCGHHFPNPDKWLPLKSEQPPVNDYPKTIQDRAIPINRWDKEFDFDSGTSPYLAFELPRYEMPYKIKVTSVPSPKLFYPIFALLDRQKRVTRCIATGHQFITGNWSRHPNYVIELPIDRDSRRDRYLIVFTTAFQANNVVTDKESYTLASVVNNYILAMLGAKPGDPPPIPHGYYGMLRLEEKPLNITKKPVADRHAH